MSFDFTSAKVIGRPDASGWSQVHIFKPEDREKFKRRGQLFAIISTSARNKDGETISGDTSKSEGVERIFLGKEVLLRLHEEYFGKVKGGSFEVLKGAVGKVVDEFSDQGGVEIVALVLLGEVVYTVASGGSKTAIFREGVFSEILTSKDNRIVSASGYLKNQDILLLSSSSFSGEPYKEMVRVVMGSGDIHSAAEMLAPIVHSRQLQGNMAVLLVKFTQKGNFKPRHFEVQTETGVSPSVRTGVSKRLSRVASLADKLPKKKVFVQAMTSRGGIAPQRKKTSLSVGLVLLFLLVTSIFFGIKQKKQIDFKASYQVTLDQARHELTEASEIHSINPSRARELFIGAQEKVLGLAAESISDPDLESLVSSLEKAESEMLGIFKMPEELYVDLSLLSSRFSGDLISASQGRVFVLDKEGERIVGVAVGTKRTEIVAGPSQIADPLGIASYSDRVFILNSKGVFEVGENFDKVVEVGWDGEALPFAYAGNFYVLDRETSTIWRHYGTASGFTEGSSWFAPGVEVDLSDASSWVIDGSIWILTKSGRILKFTHGNPQRFAIANVYPNLDSPSAIYTSDELEYLYVLDKSGSRVVVLTKDGEYKAQYVSEGIGNAKDLFVSEEEKRIILLTGEKLVSVGVKHL
jgi:hypothetical protein